MVKILWSKTNWVGKLIPPSGISSSGISSGISPTFGYLSHFRVSLPLRALMDTINPLDFTQPALPAIKEVIAIYLDQLDYLMRWSRIKGKNVGDAKIKHPFWISEL